MTNENPQIPHDITEHNELQIIVEAVNYWFNTPVGQVFKEETQDKGYPPLMLHLLKDTAAGDPAQLPHSITTSFMTGAMFMREWMIERQSEPMPDQIIKMKKDKEEK